MIPDHVVTNTACVAGSVGCMSAAYAPDMLHIIVPVLIASIITPLATVFIDTLRIRLKRWANADKPE